MTDFDALEMRLLGAFQFNNAAIAITLFLLWLHRSHPNGHFPDSRPRCGRGCATRAGRAGSR